MKLLLTAAIALAAASAAPAQPVEARLTVGQEAAGPRIEPTGYGHFVEHLGTGGYGGLWVGQVLALPAKSVVVVVAVD